MPRSHLSIELERFTKKIFAQAQAGKMTILTDSDIQSIEKNLNIRFETAFRDSEHSIHFSELIENLFSIMSIEKFIRSEDKPQYEKILNLLIKIMVNHYQHKDRFNAPSVNCQISLLEWIDGTPGSDTVRQILQPLFHEIYHSMGGDRVHAYERYKDIKILAHKLGLKGRVRFETHRRKLIEVDLEGYEASYTFDAIIVSLKIFLEENQDLLEKLEMQILQDAIKSIELGHRAKHHHLEETFLNQLQAHYKSGNPLVLTSGVNRHSMNYIIDNNTLIYINRGFQAEAGKYGSIIYKIGDTSQVTAEFIREVVVASNATRDDQDIRMKFLKDGLKNTLRVVNEIIHHHSAKKQKVGNCTWANIKEMFRLLLAVLHKKTNAEISWESAIGEMEAIYKGWSKWDRTFGLKNFVEKYSQDDMILETEKSFLKLILTQKYDTFKLDEVERAQFIIQCLGTDEVLSCVKETQKNIKKMPPHFDFQLFLEFIDKCSHVHAKELTGTLDLSTELMKIHSSYIESMSTDESLEVPIESYPSSLKHSSSLNDLTQTILSKKPLLTFRESLCVLEDTPCGCQEHCIQHEEEKPKLNRSKSAVF